MEKTLGKALLIAVLAVASRAAPAFTLNYDSANAKTINAWASPNLQFDYDYSACPASVDSAALTSAVTSALSVWNGVPSSTLDLSIGAQVSTTASAALAQTQGGNPLVICDANFSNDTGLDGNSVPAAAKIVQVDASYHITFAVLLLNADTSTRANIGAVDSDLLSVVMAHEIGHSLGLGHSSDINALMYYDATAKKKLSLAKDDVDGITYLYPRNELGGSKMLGCNSTRFALPGGGIGIKRGAESRGEEALMAELALLLLLCWAGFRQARGPWLRTSLTTRSARSLSGSFPSNGCR